MDIERKVYTVAQVSEMYGVSIEFVYAAIHAGHLRALRMGRVLRIPFEAVEEWTMAAATGAAS